MFHKVKAKFHIKQLGLHWSGPVTRFSGMKYNDIPREVLERHKSS
jgi:hypothetical protein